MDYLAWAALYVLSLIVSVFLGMYFSPFKKEKIVIKYKTIKGEIVPTKNKKNKIVALSEEDLWRKENQDEKLRERD